jgi:hypothetical protein
MTIEYHMVTVDPPSKHRPTWLVTCSKGDFNQSFLNKVEAKRKANKHIDDKVLQNELDQGTYVFDDGGR